MANSNIRAYPRSDNERSGGGVEKIEAEVEKSEREEFSPDSRAKKGHDLLLYFYIYGLVVTHITSLSSRHTTPVHLLHRVKEGASGALHLPSNLSRGWCFKSVLFAVVVSFTVTLWVYVAAGMKW